MKRIVRFAALAVVLLSMTSLSQAEIFTYTANLPNAPEVPPNASLGVGIVTVEYDSTAHTLSLQTTWSGLGSPTSVSHIHCCTASPFSGAVGVAVTPGTLPGFPGTGSGTPGLTAGSYTTPLLDLTLAATFTPGFVTNFAGGVLADAEEALIAGFNDERAYFNIHTDLLPGGEIRGFLQLVPEPASIALLGLALAGLGFSRRKKA